MNSNFVLVTRTWAVAEPACRRARVFGIAAPRTRMPAPEAAKNHGPAMRWRLNASGRLCCTWHGGPEPRDGEPAVSSWRRLVTALSPLTLRSGWRVAA